MEKVLPPATPPRSDTETILVGIWEDVLQTHPIGLDDNFLDLGGHSLAATQVIAQIIQAFDIELPLKALFSAPTIAQMATIISAHQARAGSAEELARLLSEVEGMDDDQARQQLKTEQVD